MSTIANTLPPFGVSEFTTWPWTFEQDVANYSTLGVDAIEICEFKLDPSRALYQLRSVAEAGLTISSVQPRLHSLFPDGPRPQPVEPKERMAHFKDTVRRFGQAAPGTTMVTISGAAPDGNYRLAYQTAVEQYRELAQFAGEYGVRVALEPLNPILMNVDTFLCSIEDAMEVVMAVDSPNLGIFIDVWHIWAYANAAQQIEKCGPHIFGVHINDWHRPRHFGDRISLGEGIIPLTALLRAIHKSGYNGAYTLEIFSSQHLENSLWNGDLTDLVSQNKRSFARLWQEAMGA